MTRSFEVLRPKLPYWREVSPGQVRQGDVVRVKDAGTVVAALADDVPDQGDPQTYFVFSNGTTSTVKDPDGPGSVEVGVSVLHPDGGVYVIPLETP